MSKISNKEDLILVGVVSSAHGIKGNVMIKSFTSPISNIKNLDLLDQNLKIINLKVLRENAKGYLICKIEGSCDRNHAESLKDTKLFCLKEKLPSLSEDEFYFEDLKNLIVKNTEGKNIGIISGVFNYGAGDIIAIKFDSTQKEEMIPFTKELFPEITKNYVVFSKNNFRME